MRIPLAARYDRTMKFVESFLQQEAVTRFPLDVISVIKRNKWGLITYSELAAVHHKSLNQVIQAFGSEDGYTIRDSQNYTIAYNDKIKSSGRLRFTLMHEIGHIYLGHMVDFDRTKIYRNRLSKTEYKVLENEADCFARNALAPNVIVRFLDLKDPRPLMRYFGLSFQAANARLNMLKLDFSNPLHFMTKQAWHFLKEIRYGRLCANCGHFFIYRNPKFCPVCGQAGNFTQGADNKVIYDGIEMNENLYPQKCPVCDNQELDGESEFCSICGAQVINRCTGIRYGFNNEVEWECNEILDGKARYCHKCGNKSTYLQQKILRPWEEVKEGASMKPKSPHNGAPIETSTTISISDDDLPF